MALSLLLFLLFHVLSAVVSTVKPGDVGFVEDFLELNQEADNDTIPPSTLMHTQPNPSLHPLWTRTPSDYAGCSHKGDCLLAKLASNPGPPSLYTNWGQLTAQHSGWYGLANFGAMPTNLGMTNVLKAAGWRSDNWYCAFYQYPQPWVKPDPGAKFKIYVQPDQGIIIVSLAYKPGDPVLQDGVALPNPIPWAPAPQPVTRLSDQVFLVHQKACNDDAACMSRLKTVVHIAVSSTITTSIMKQATGQQNSMLVSYPPWPGVVLKVGGSEPEDTAAKALIGTPNGFGNAFMLLQHQAAYAGLTIKSSAAFVNDFSTPCLAFQIG